MTQALCLNCGNLKFGALCECPECHAASTGNLGLDIAFSDHHLAESSLSALGDFIKKLASRTEDRGTVFWSFINYVSENHQEILQAEVPPEYSAKVTDLLSRTDIPMIALKPPPGLRPSNN